MGLTMALVLHGVYLASLPPGVPVPSAGYCAYKCYHQWDCSSVVYDGSTKKCHLSTEVYLERDLTSTPNNMQYFVWKRDDCDVGYTWYRSLGLCYKIYTSKKTWFQANHTCHQDGGHLIKVDSDGINALMNKISDPHRDRIWLGGIKDEVSGNWTWTDGSVISQAYWDYGEPSKKAEKCIGIIKEYKNPLWRWNDYICTHPGVTVFVCQLPLKGKNYY